MWCVFDKPPYGTSMPRAGAVHHIKSLPVSGMMRPMMTNAPQSRGSQFWRSGSIASRGSMANRFRSRLNFCRLTCARENAPHGDEHAASDRRRCYGFAGSVSFHAADGRRLPVLGHGGVSACLRLRRPPVRFGRRGCRRRTDLRFWRMGGPLQGAQRRVSLRLIGWGHQLFRLRPHSSSASRLTAGAIGFLILSQ
jgi:hypothetical protein